MSVKPKTVRRMLVLGVVALVLAAGGVGFVVVGNRQTARAIAEYRRLGLEAAARKDYPAVLNNLYRSLRRNENDPEALLAYARARVALEEPDGAHLEQAIAYYFRYQGLRPDDREAGAEFLDLCVRSGRFPEALGVAAQLLPGNLEQCVAGDVPILKNAALAAANTRPPDPALPRYLERAARLAPLDVDAQLPYLDHLHELKKHPEASAWGDAIAKAHPDDPRARLIKAMGAVDSFDDAQVASLFPVLCSLAGLDAGEAKRTGSATYPDEAFALRIVGMLDVMGRHEHAAMALIDAGKQLRTPELSRRAARRAWEGGDPARALDAIGTPTLADGVEPVAFRALALRQLARNEEASAALTPLGERSWDFHARAFAMAIPHAFPADSVAAASSLKPLRDAQHEDPTEPVLAYLLGDCLSRLGRADDALAMFERAATSPRAGAWALPWIRQSQLALATGRTEQALQSAQQALERSPRNAIAHLAQFSARLAQLPARKSPSAEALRLLRFADSALGAMAQAPDAEVGREWTDTLTSGKARLLVILEKRDDAARMITEVLGRTPPPSRTLLENLAIISIEGKLGFEDRLLGLAESEHGLAPSTVRIRAEMARLVGRNDDALRILNDALPKAKTEEIVSYKREIASMMDAIGDANAGATWIALAEENPSDISLQRAAIASPSAGSDAAFVERAAERILKSLGEPDAFDSGVQLARARALLTSGVGSRARSDAVDMLRAIVEARPSALDARLLLIDALLRSDPARGIRPDLDEAISQLRVAAEGSSDRALLLFRAVSLLQERQNFEQARSDIRALAREFDHDERVQRRCAQLLIAQGDQKEALPILRAVLAKQAENAAPDVLALTASVLAGERQNDEAKSLYARAAAHPALPLDSVPFVAAGLARLGDVAGGEALAKRLEHASPPDRRAMLFARYAELSGKVEAAVEQYKEAVRLSPDDEEVTTRYVESLLRSGGVASAGPVLDAALKKFPESPTLRVLALRAAIAGGDASPKTLRDLADALAKDPARAPEAELLRAVGAARERGDFENADALVALAARFPSSPPLQSLVVRQLMGMRPSDGEAAARIASRAMLSFPSLSEPARLAAAVYTNSAQWTQVISAARAWAERDPSALIESNIAIARAHLAMGQPDRALGVIKPHVQDFLSSPGSPRSMAGLELYAKAMIEAKAADAVRAELLPSAKSSREFRNQVWLRVAATMLPTLEAARAWIDDVKDSIGPNEPDDQVALASAHAQLARFDATRRESLEKSLALLRPLAEAKDASAPVIELYARTLSMAGDAERAGAAFRRAIEVDPSSPSPKAALSVLLASRNPGSEEALRLAESAFESSSGEDAEIMEVYAGALLQRGLAARAKGEDPKVSFAQAAALYKRLANADSSSIPRLLSLASAAELAGDVDTCIDAYQRILVRAGLEAKVRAAVQNNFAFMLVRAKRGYADLARAETAARDALRNDPNPSYASTLGRVLVALGQREAAIAAFRQALSGNPQHVEARMGLAGQLATGSRMERAEALRFVEELRGAAEVLATLSPSDRSALDELGAQLAGNAQVDVGK